MAVTAGIITVQSVQANSASLVSSPATAGTGPYTYQWYRSSVTGFTPGAGNLIAGATGLSLSDSGLIPNSTYFYKIRATDTGAGNTTSDSAQATVVTAAPSFGPMNQFVQSQILGQTDLRMNYNTISVQIDVSQTGKLYPGQPIKFVAGGTGVGGVPKVVACAASSDECYGFINYDSKTQYFQAGSLAEVSQNGNCLYLYATTAIPRGKQVTMEVGVPGTSVGGVSLAVAASGKEIVGWAFDEAVNPGDLIRVRVMVPSFKVA